MRSGTRQGLETDQWTRRRKGELAEECSLVERREQEHRWRCSVVFRHHCLLRSFPHQLQRRSHREVEESFVNQLDSSE